jgi:N-methylhydantoinase A
MRPTLTDAQVALGRINAQRPLGGELKSLDVEAAKRAIDTHVAGPLAIGVPQAADAIVRVAEARMAGAIRLVSIERGTIRRSSSPCRSAAAGHCMSARSSV